MNQIAVRALLPSREPSLPPMVLVHGAANSAAVWTYWQQELASRGWPTYAVDLRGHGASSPVDLSKTSMEDYADDVDSVVRQLRAQPVLLGWSMGGLVAMMVAARGGCSACVCLAPSTPARQVDQSAPLREGVFGPEEYGLGSCSQAEMDAVMPELDHDERKIAVAWLGPESRLARDERARGIVLNELARPVFLVIGCADTQWPEERYAEFPISHDRLLVPNASHWGLVLNREAVSFAATAVTDWLSSGLSKR